MTGLSFSNIAWGSGEDGAVYSLLVRHGFDAVEVAPTRLFPTEPYTHIKDAGRFASWLRDKYALTVCSMQSIWYGRKENIFRGREDREALLDYTRQAVDFASAMGCRNLVFGCPANRRLGGHGNPGDAEPFLLEAGKYASGRGCTIGIEANPPIYGTDFLNTTVEVLELVERLNAPGIGVNLDTGAMVYSGEGADILRGRVHLISHVHISEPGLAPIKERMLHGELAALLADEGYKGHVSVEMGNTGDIRTIAGVMGYIGGMFR